MKTATATVSVPVRIQLNTVNAGKQQWCRCSHWSTLVHQAGRQEEIQSRFEVVNGTLFAGAVQA